jgi:hypothetical protein
MANKIQKKVVKHLKKDKLNKIIKKSKKKLKFWTNLFLSVFFIKVKLLKKLLN